MQSRIHPIYIIHPSNILKHAYHIYPYILQYIALYTLYMHRICIYIN